MTIRFVVGSLLLALIAGCGADKARSLLPVDIEPVDVAGIANVNIYVRQGDVNVYSDQLDWTAPAGQAAKLGLYLDRTISGAVTVEATGIDERGQIIGQTDSQPATITPGKTAAVVTLRMMKSGGGMGDGGADMGTPAGDGPAPDAGPPTDMAAPSDGPAPDAGATPDAGPDVSVGLTWKPGENVEKDMLNRSFWPAVATDAKGNVLLSWNETNVLKVRRYDAATRTWQASKTVESMGSIDEVAIRMSPDGHATAIWNQNVNDVMLPLAGVWAAHSKDGGNTWSAPKQVHSGRQYGEIELVVAASGDARATWEETPVMPNLRSVWSARYDEATGLWSDVAMVRMGEDTDYRFQKIAMDQQGNGLLVWMQADAMGNGNIWASSFAAKQPLRTPQLLDTLVTGDTDDPAVAMAADGSRGIVVWGQNAPTGTDVMASEWTPAGGFAAPAKIVGTSNYTGAHAVVIDHTAAVTAAWTQPFANGRANLVAVRRPAGQAWGEVTPMETTNQSPSEFDKYPYPEMGVDAAGNVHVAWTRKMNADEKEFTYAAVVRRFSMGKWENEVIVGHKAKLRALNPAIAVSPNGTAAVTWFYSDLHDTGDTDAYNVFAALFQ
jgi:hypothetical protein